MSQKILNKKRIDNKSSWVESESKQNSYYRGAFLNKTAMTIVIHCSTNKLLHVKILEFLQK